MQLNAVCQKRKHQLLITQTLRCMKITALLLFMAVLQVSAVSRAQNVTLREKKATLEKVMAEIRQQTGYSFFYNQDWLAQAQPVDVEVRNLSLEQALKAVFMNQPFTYEVVERTVVLKLKEKGNVPNGNKLVQDQVIVSAKVIDELGNPLPGASVRNRDEKTGVTTGKNGEFTLVVPDPTTHITITYIGYEPVDLRAKDIVNGSTITLKASTSNLHEVVVSKGYYDEKQALSTGNVGVVTAKQISEEPITNVLQAIEGRIPGIVVQQTTGVPGGGYTVQIRGQNSLFSGTNPFFVIDGVPYDAQLPSTYNGPQVFGTTSNGVIGSSNPLNYINPYDIESIEVLKDADATAIYGARAANGAILITTKKGKAGKAKVDINLQSGLSMPDRLIKLMNTQQYLQVRHQALSNDGKNPYPSIASNPGDPNYDINGAWDTTRYTDWVKVLADQTSHFNNAQATLSGGNTLTQYLVSANYNEAGGPFPALLPGQGKNEMTALHLSLNTETEDHKLEMQVSASYSVISNTLQLSDFTQTAVTLSPDAPAIHNADGSLNWQPLTAGGYGTWYNPFAYLLQPYQQNSNDLVSHINLKYHILKGLTFNLPAGYSILGFNDFSADPVAAQDPGFAAFAQSYANYVYSKTSSWILEPQLNFDKAWTTSKFNALFGATFHQNKNDVEYFTGFNYPNDALLQNPESAGSLTAQSNNAQYKQASFYGRLNYSVEDKYIINVTARRDGSSRFGSGKQYGNFGAVGVAWIFSKEKFVTSNLPWLSFGKLRGSYGVTGNDQIANYQFLDLYNSVVNPYNGAPGLAPVGLPNANLQWEVDKKLEGAIDLGFLNDRINFSASYFRNRSGNQLVSEGLSATTSLGSIYANLPALIQNTGIELTLTTQNFREGDFSWSTSFNYTSYRNKLLAFPGLAESQYASRLVIGQPFTVVKVYHMLGVDPQTGLYMYSGANGPTSQPNQDTDENTLVNLQPKFFGGVSNTLNYKNFSLDFLFQFVKQTGYNYNSIYADNAGRMVNLPLGYLNSWQKPGDHAEFEKYTQSFFSPAGRASGSIAQSDFAYSDASYIRLKNLALSYSLPKQIDQQLGLQQLRVFIQGQNLFTITKFQGVDPETQGILTPPMRVYSLGIQASF